MQTSTALSLFHRSTVETLWTRLFCQTSVSCLLRARSSTKRHISQFRARPIRRKRPLQTLNTNSPESFRRTWKPCIPGPIADMQKLSAFGIRSKSRRILREYIQIALLYNANPFLSINVKRFSEKLVSFLYHNECYISRRGVNPSILFVILRLDPPRRKEIRALLSVLSVAKQSQERTAVCLRLAFNLTRYSNRCPLLFQAALKSVLDEQAFESDEIAMYFRRRKFTAKRIKYSPRELVDWLIDCVVSNPSMQSHMPYVAMILRSWDIGIHPIRLIHALMPTYIVPDPSSNLNIEKWRSSTHILHYNTFIPMAAHTIRRSNPEEVDIVLVETLILSLIDTDLYLYSITIFDALRDIELDSWVDLEILLPFLRKLVTTENYHDAIRVYKAVIDKLRRFEFKTAKKVDILDPSIAQFHSSFLHHEMDALVDLFRGLRQSESSHEFVIHLLSLIPRQVVRDNPVVAAEMLYYAGYWNNRDIVRKVLNAIKHPFYDESYTIPSQPPRYEFSEDIWSAILYAHVHVGLVNSSRPIIQSMQAQGLAPRPGDMSAIVCGVAKFNLDNGYDLAVKLGEALDVSAYETLLELALERDNVEIAEWAKSRVAYDRHQKQLRTVDEEVQTPTVFDMNSDLSSTLSKITARRTPRAVGAIINHVAVTQGVEKAISMLVDSSMTFSRDVYDKLYQIAYENGQIHCAMWVASELRQRGWMPQYYREVKREILTHRRLEGKWKWK
jgi:hypothetical protein